MINQGVAIIGLLVNYFLFIIKYNKYLFLLFLGYYDKRKNSLGETLLERVMLQVEKEIAYSSSPVQFVILHSLAGGTGSGNFL